MSGSQHWVVRLSFEAGFRRRIKANSFCWALGICVVVLVYVGTVTNGASADVDTVGGLEKASSTTRSSLNHVEPLFTKASGDYECSLTYAYSDVQNAADSFVIGNCKGPAEIKVVSYSGPNGEGFHSYGGFVTGTFSGCGWVEARFEPEKLNNNSNSSCGEGSTGDFEVSQCSFMYQCKHNSAVGDGWPVVNIQACPEYANYRPWSSNNLEQELVRTAPAYAGSGPGSNYPALKWRYVTAYESTDGTGQYVMVRDDRYKAGEGNWVFVPRSCLQGSLPENENERLPPPPTVTTTAASNVTTTQATLSGTVNPNGIEATYHFEYGTTTAYGSSTYPGDAGTGTITEPEGYVVSGLQPGTTYHYRIVAWSATGTREGEDRTFTTASPPINITPPTIVVSGSQPEVGVSQGSTNGSWGYAPTSYSYQWESCSGSVCSRISGATGSSYTPMPADTGKGLKVTVTAINSWGSAAATSETTAQVLDADAPGASLGKNGTVYIATRSASDQLFVTSHESNGNWIGPMSVPGSWTVLSAPSSVVDSSGNTWFAAEGPGNTLYASLRYANGTWSQPIRVAGAGTTYSAPSTVVDAAGNVWFTAEGPGNTMETTLHYVSGSWSETVQVAGSATTYSAPSTVVDSVGNVWFAAEGPNTVLDATLYYISGSWSSMITPGGVGTMGDF